MGKGGLKISNKNALRDMAIAIDTIEIMCFNSHGSDANRQTLNAVRIIISELGRSLRGERPRLETSSHLGKLQIMIQNDLAEETLH